MKGEDKDERADPFFHRWKLSGINVFPFFLL
jgi:hypothetical protein